MEINQGTKLKCAIIGHSLFRSFYLPRVVSWVSSGPNPVPKATSAARFLPYVSLRGKKENLGLLLTFMLPFILGLEWVLKKKWAWGPELNL